MLQGVTILGLSVRVPVTDLELTFDVMSPRHCGENEMNLRSFWAIAYHELLGSY